MSDNPWCLPEVAQQQRELVDRQLQQHPWPQHLRAFAEAVKATSCAGSILEVGCASGYGREILDRAGVGYRSYGGIDISGPAIEIAKERYPESSWSTIDRTVWMEAKDIVIDGCALMHVDDWQQHIAKLCRMSRRWVILHRVPNGGPETVRTETAGYGQTFPAWSFNRDDIIQEMAKHGFSTLVRELAADGGSATLVFA